MASRSSSAYKKRWLFNLERNLDDIKIDNFGKKEKLIKVILVSIMNNFFHNIPII